MNFSWWKRGVIRFHTVKDIFNSSTRYSLHAALGLFSFPPVVFHWHKLLTITNGTSTGPWSPVFCKKIRHNSPWGKGRSLLGTLCICSIASAGLHAPPLLMPLPAQTPWQPHRPPQQPEVSFHGREPTLVSAVVVVGIPPPATGILKRQWLVQQSESHTIPRQRLMIATLQWVPEGNIIAWWWFFFMCVCLITYERVEWAGLRCSICYLPLILFLLY